MPPRTLRKSRRTTVGQPALSRLSSGPPASLPAAAPCSPDTPPHEHHQQQQQWPGSGGRYGGCVAAAVPPAIAADTYAGVAMPYEVRTFTSLDTS